MTSLHEGMELALAGQDLREDQAYDVMMELMGGNASNELIAGFLVAMRAKGETAAELAGLARGMREKATRIHPTVNGRLMDTCGTGGARVKAFNVSTTAAFVVAAAGLPVAKHGNRSVTRPSGSADVLQALGANLDASPADVERCISRLGIGFLFAPAFHPAMKYAMPARKALGTRTVFNVLGPLTNPAGAQGHVLGVYDRSLLKPMATALNHLGVERALVVHGQGLDEATLDGPTQYAELRSRTVTEGEFAPADVGLVPRDARTFAAQSPAESAAAARLVLAGQGDAALTDFTALNAGLALYVGGRARDRASGVSRARDALASGKGLDRLDAFVAATQEGAAS